MKNLFIALVFSCFATFTFAQSTFNDYIITTKNDTIYGKIEHLNKKITEKSDSGSISKVGIEIDTKEETIFFEKQDIKAFYFKNRFYRVISYFQKRTGDKKYFYLCMIIDGKQKFGAIGCDLFESIPYMLYDKKYMPVTPNNLIQNIWPEMMLCAPFADLHDHMTDKNLKKIVRMNRYNELSIIIEKYNQLCSQ